MSHTSDDPPRLLAIMGSGETAPTMVKLHRQILDATPAGAAVMLDTPFGFQRNADDLVTRTVGYFEATSCNAKTNLAVTFTQESDLSTATATAPITCK